MSRKYKFYNPEGVYFVSLAVKEWIDAELLFLSKHKAQVDTCASSVCLQKKHLILV